MDMQQFIKEYSENLLKALQDQEFGVESVEWMCSLCPLKNACKKDSAENPDDTTSCGEYIRKSVTDGDQYRK